jgi:hypothetical protein
MISNLLLHDKPVPLSNMRSHGRTTECITNPYFASAQAPAARHRLAASPRLLKPVVAFVEYCLCVGIGPRRLCPWPDQTFYLVINNYGKSGAAFAETDVEQTDLETVIADLMSGPV